MEPNHLFHHFGLMAFGLILLVMAVTLKKWGKDHALSLSGHAARQRPSYLVFLGGLLAAGVLFYGFGSQWLAPTLGLDAAFAIVLAAATVLELITAIVPDIAGVKSNIHRIAAWSMAVCMGVLGILVAFAPGLSALARTICIILVGYMGFALLLFLFVKRSRAYFLLFQGSYVLSFFAVMLVATYLR